MSGHFYSAIYLLTFSVAFMAVVVTIGYAMGTIFQLRPQYNRWSDLYVPLIPLLPTRMFTDQGAVSGFHY
jgi:hypothetical protein